MAKEDDKKNCKPQGKKGNRKTKKKLNEVQIMHEEEEGYDVTIIGSKRQHELGPMDRFASKTDPEASSESIRTMRQQNIYDALFKKLNHGSPSNLSQMGLVIKQVFSFMLLATTALTDFVRS